MATVALERQSAAHPVRSGIAAGLVGGIVFGMLMAMTGVLPMIAKMVGSSSGGVGFVVHMAISAVIGSGYGLVAARFPARYGTHAVAGMAYGMVWWVLGGLIAMPLALGMPDMVLSVGSDQWMSLMGHVIYGLVTGLTFARLSRTT